MHAVVTIKLHHRLGNYFKEGQVFNGIPRPWIIQLLENANEQGLKGLKLQNVIYYPNYPINEDCDTVVMEFE